MRIEIPGEPVPKERPRFNRATGTVYTPRATKAYEEMVAYSAMAAGKRLDGPVEVTLWVYTDNHKADLDNAIKAIGDGLNGHAYKDDRQICEWHVYRVWSTNPRVVVTVEAVEARSEVRPLGGAV